MRKLGAPDHIVKQYIDLRISKEQDVEVLEQNWTAAQWFRDVQTQWRYAGMAGLATGLDYQGVESAARMLGYDVAEFPRLKYMESVALRHYASKRRD